MWVFPPGQHCKCVPTCHFSQFFSQRKIEKSLGAQPLKPLKSSREVIHISGKQNQNSRTESAING